MAENFANHYQTTLTAAVASGALTGTVASATGVPAVPFRAMIDSEIVLVTGRTGTTLTWTRAAEAVAGVQTAAAHASGATLTAIVTAAQAARWEQPLGWLEVRDFGAVGDDATDDTVAIQAALTAARTAGGGRVVGYPGDTYRITDPLVIGSNTTLDMTGCTVHMPHSLTPMLKNHNHLAGSRDTDIEITGGTWSETGTHGDAETEGDTHRIFVNQVDRLNIHDLRLTTTSGKYGLSLTDVTYFRVTGLTIDVRSDGIHVTGPASFGYIANIAGASLDDFVALGCSDYTSYDVSRGDITDITIETLKPNNVAGAGRGVALFTTGDPSYAPQALAIRRITIRDIKGSLQASGVYITDLANASAAFTDITVSDVNVRVISGEGLFDIAPAGNLVAGIQVENLHIPANAADNTKAVWVRGNTNGITVSGIRSSGSTLRATGVYVDDNVTVGSIVLSNVQMTLATAISNVVNLGAGVTVSDLSLLNIAVDGAGNGNVVQLSGSGAITRCNLVNVTYNGGGGGIIYHQSSQPWLDVSFSNLRMVSGGVIFYIVGTGGIIVRGSGATAPTYWVYKTAAQNVICYSWDIQVDVDVLTKVAGSVAYNTNGGHACGAGPVVSQGTNWKGLYSGTAY